MTRLEKIRSMSAEELAKMLVEDGNYDGFCKKEFCPAHTGKTCAFFVEKDPENFEALDAACLCACINYLNAEIEDK